MANSVSPPTLPLADIHLQQAPSFWPLAWGWWLVIAAVLIAMVAAFVIYRRREQHLAAQKEALNALQGMTTLSDINALLKRAALTYFPRDNVAALTSERWMAFLDSQLPAAQQGFVATGKLWQKGVFSAHPLSDDELAQCKALAEKWLKQALPPRHAASQTQEAQHV